MAVTGGRGDPATVTLTVDRFGPAFVPISVIDDGASGMPVSSTMQRQGLIEIDLGGGRQVRVDCDVNASALRRVLGVLSGR